MSGVRPATEADLPAMVRLAQAFHQESPTYRGVTFDPEKLRWFLGECLRAPSYACLVYESSAAARIRGMLIGFVQEYFFSREKAASDLMVFVEPEARGSLIAYRLWSGFHDWARRSGVRMLSVGTAAGVSPDRTRRFYTGLGMTEIGAVYQMDLK